MRLPDTREVQWATEREEAGNGREGLRLAFWIKCLLIATLQGYMITQVNNLKEDKEVPLEKSTGLIFLEFLCGSLLLISDIKLFYFSFSPQPKGFRRYYSSPLLIHEQFGCIKEVMPIGELGR